jgi:hypothetical protein
MGGLKKRGGVGASSLKRGEESSKFPIANFVLLFSSTIYIRFFDILAAQNKNHFYVRLILKEVIHFYRNLFLGLG